MARQTLTIQLDEDELAKLERLLGLSGRTVESLLTEIIGTGLDMVGRRLRRINARAAKVDDTWDPKSDDLEIPF